MQCLISSCIIFKLVTILKWKVNFSFLLFITSLVILMLLWHILRAKQMPQSTVWNQSGHCFFSRPGANNYSTASCAALLLQCLSYTLTSHSSALAWAVWHRIRLPVDTVPASPFFTFTLSLCLPHKLSQDCTPSDGLHFYLGLTHLNIELWSVPEGNCNREAIFFTVKYWGFPWHSLCSSPALGEGPHRQAHICWGSVCQCPETGGDLLCAP